MSMSHKKHKKKDDGCPCGQAYVLAVYMRDQYDEWAVPFAVIAVPDCPAAEMALQAVEPDKHIVEVMASRRKHFREWLERDKP